MELNVYNIKGEVTDKKVTLNDSITELNLTRYIWLAIKHYLAITSGTQNERKK